MFIKTLYIIIIKKIYINHQILESANNQMKIYPHKVFLKFLFLIFSTTFNYVNNH